MDCNHTNLISSNQQILIIEDEAILKKVMAFSLHKAGYKTIEASNGEEARKILKARSVEIILLDIGLPDCNGLDLLEEIREFAPEVAVIVMTAQDTVENIDRTKRLGASALFIKPIILKQLKETIRAVGQNQVRRQDNFLQSMIKANLKPHIY